MKLFRRLFVAFITLLSCQHSFSGEVANQHQWSDQQRSALNHLWIGKLTDRKDTSNASVNNADAIRLGHRLFFDTRLSANNQISCASCHQPGKNFSDQRLTAKGLSTVTRNTPSIIGSSQHTWFFHDGRADSLWSQALMPFENDKEHGTNRNHIVHTLYNDPVLRKLYESAFHKLPDLSNHDRFPRQAGPVSDKSASKAWRSMRAADRATVTNIFVNAGKAIAAYESQLQFAPSRFDRYVEAMNNNNDAQMRKLLNNDEARGLRLFIGKANCLICHNGPMLTDFSFHNILIPAVDGKQFDWGRYSGSREVVKSPFNCRSPFNDNPNHSCDELKFIVTDQHETLGAMKTPSLRNVSRTAPYMHAGQYATLNDVLKHYVDPPRDSPREVEMFPPIKLDDNEVRQLEAFLHTLDSEIAAPAELLKPSN